MIKYRLVRIRLLIPWLYLEVFLMRLMLPIPCLCVNCMHEIGLTSLMRFRLWSPHVLSVETCNLEHGTRNQLKSIFCNCDFEWHKLILCRQVRNYYLFSIIFYFMCLQILEMRIFFFVFEQKCWRIIECSGLYLLNVSYFQTKEFPWKVYLF